MEEIKRINKLIAIKQTGRFVLGIGSVIFGGILIKNFIYQKGITDCQKALINICPEEYEAMTKKMLTLYEDHE